MPGGVTAIIAVGVGLPLDPGAYYRWTAEVDGETRPEWGLRFYVRRDNQEFPPQAPSSVSYEPGSPPTP